MQMLKDVLLALFLALGSAWFVVDLVRKLRQPAGVPAIARRPTPVAEALAPLASASVPPASAAIVAPVGRLIPAPEPAPLMSGVPAPHLVAITAAVHHLFRGRARLVSALAAPAMPAANTHAHAPIDWAREGRRDIFTSHRVR